MECAKPGHGVIFEGLKGAAHLNGTKGTLVKFLKKERRWSVRCDLDNNLVNSKPINLVRCSPSGDDNESPASSRFGNRGKESFANRGIGSFASRLGSKETAMFRELGIADSQMEDVANKYFQQEESSDNPSIWANGADLSQNDKYEWFSNCYQMRCDDDYKWGGGDLHGPYDPYATPESISDDFLVYCTLANRIKAVPRGWDWKDFLQVAANHIAFAFEKSDAQDRWGSENYFKGEMGGRSLRYTGTKIYNSPVDQPGRSREQSRAEESVTLNKLDLQKQAGGQDAWAQLVHDLGRCNRFA